MSVPEERRPVPLPCCTASAPDAHAASAAPESDRTARLNAGPRCGARTRRGTPCQAPAVSGKKRCRMHGGAAGTGAPISNRNAVKTGHYTAAALAERRALRALLRQAREFLETLH